LAINFRLPGPTPLPPTVLAAMQRPMIPHRGPESKALLDSILDRARRIHQTESDVLIWPASGSAGWETAIVNLLAPGDEALAVVAGNFGDRFAAVGEAFGLTVHRLDVPWGQAPTADMVDEALRTHPGVKAVFLTHNETSTGVTFPLAAISDIVHAHDALAIVDAVSSAGALPLRMDEWGLDFVFSGSQKAWMCPPGLMIAAVGPRAWDAIPAHGFPRFFWDLRSARKAAAQGTTPTTPPLTLFYAFDAALDLILAEGVEAVWARHARLGSLTRAGIKSLGLELFADEAYGSDTVTAFKVPAGLTAKALLAHMRERHEIELASGQAAYADSVVRIGHMGWAFEADLQAVLDGLAETIPALMMANV
jgi:aspartate aminotransferase-like enzyme